ncbi:MAG: butyrate kinase, partial [Bacilli bacterium]|nr:butyrate kinase [Bacilli bacterium]
LETSDGFAITRRIEEDDQAAAFYLEAMAYQIVKEIGALTYAASGKIDAVILTGGFANSRHLITFIRKYLPEDVNLRVYPGEDEINALVMGVLRVCNREENVQYY